MLVIIAKYSSHSSNLHVHLYQLINFHCSFVTFSELHSDLGGNVNVGKVMLLSSFDEFSIEHPLSVNITIRGVYYLQQRFTFLYVLVNVLNVP